MNRRQFVGTLSTGAALATLGTASLELAGCSAIQDLETWVPIGLAAFDGIVTLINPVAGSALDLAVKALDVVWTAVATAVANYQHDTTDPKATLLQKVVAALNSLAPALDNFLSTFLGGLPVGIQNAVEAGFGLLVATITSIASRLGTPSTVAIVNKKAIPIVTPTSKGQFITAYNNIPGLTRKIK